jgi:proteasome lid subunit RPN8/RPN11
MWEMFRKVNGQLPSPFPYILPSFFHASSLAGSHSSSLYLAIVMAAREKPIGFYHTGPTLRSSDLEISELFKRFVPKPVMVIVDVRPTGGRGDTGIPTDAYFAVEEIKDVSRSLAFRLLFPFQSRQLIQDSPLFLDPHPLFRVARSACSVGMPFPCLTLFSLPFPLP